MEERPNLMDKLLTYEKKIKFFLKRRNTVVILNYLFIIKCKGAQKARVSTTKSIQLKMKIIKEFKTCF